MDHKVNFTKMYRLRVVALYFLILANCANFQSQRTIKFEDGRSATVYFEITESDAGEKIFVVDFENYRTVRRVSEVEKEVVEIWRQVRKEADKADLEEGVIKYSFPTGAKNAEGKPIFEGLIFTADRKENGEWSIKRTV